MGRFWQSVFHVFSLSIYTINKPDVRVHCSVPKLSQVNLIYIMMGVATANFSRAKKLRPICLSLLFLSLFGNHHCYVCLLLLGFFVPLASLSKKIQVVLVLAFDISS